MLPFNTCDRLIEVTACVDLTVQCTFVSVDLRENYQFFYNEYLIIIL